MAALPSAAVAEVQVIDVDKAFDGTPVLRSVSLEVQPGTICALLGPSGCGKTTLLRSIAGLERIDRGQISVAGRMMDDGHSMVPPEQRGVGMVFQDWALFPHMSVRRNVGYGLPRGERDGPRVDEVLAMVGLDGFGQRSPTTLSGGQQQRVALARAVAPRPKVLLLDEPFGSLDSALRVQVRGEVHRLLVEVGITTVFVTHDQEEAFVLGDQVAVMRDGQVLQVGTPTELYDQPVDPWVAGFVGLANLIPGVATDHLVDTALGRLPARRDMDGAVQVLVRPESLRLVPGDQATVHLVEYHGHDALIRLRLDDGLELVAREQRTQVRRGDRVAVAHAGPPVVTYPGR